MYHYTLKSIVYAHKIRRRKLPSIFETRPNIISWWEINEFVSARRIPSPL